MAQEIPCYSEYRKSGEMNLKCSFNAEDNIYDIKLAYGTHLFMEDYKNLVGDDRHQFDILVLQLLLLEFIAEDCEDRNVLS